MSSRVEHKKLFTILVGIHLVLRYIIDVTRKDALKTNEDKERNINKPHLFPLKKFEICTLL